MTNIELALTNLGEASAVEFHKNNNSTGLNELKNDMHDAGEVINKAKNIIENKLGNSIINSKNYTKLTKEDD